MAMQWYFLLVEENNFQATQKQHKLKC